MAAMTTPTAVATRTAAPIFVRSDRLSNAAPSPELRATLFSFDGLHRPRPSRTISSSASAPGR
jgi:hypothetical protein